MGFVIDGENGYEKVEGWLCTWDFLYAGKLKSNRRGMNGSKGNGRW